MIDNPRWEKCLIGTTLAFPTDASTVTDVKPEDFAFRSHQNLWTIILELERSGRLSYQAVVETLYARNQMDNLGTDVEDGDITGERYLEDLLSLRAQPSIAHFAKEVVGLSIKRNLHSLGHILALDSESAMEADKLLDKAEEAVFTLRRNTVDTGQDMGDLLAKYERVVEDWRAGRIIPAFTFTTPGLSRLVPFLEPTDFMLIAGRPGEAKSSLLRFEAYHAAMRGKKVAIFNLENDPLEYVRYLIANVSGINTTKLRQPTLLSEAELAQVRQHSARLKTLLASNLKIISLGAPSVYEIIRIARKLVSQGFEIIMVDYIQLIKNGIENEVQDITMSSSLLRGFALTHNVPVIAAAQLNREMTKRAAGAEPELPDLRGSGSLEQDATIVVFTQVTNATDAELRRLEQNRNPDGSITVRAVPIRLFCRKNRNGPIGKTDPILWLKHTNNFGLYVAEPMQVPRRTQPQPQPVQQELV